MNNTPDRIGAASGPSAWPLPHYRTAGWILPTQPLEGLPLDRVWDVGAERDRTGRAEFDR